MRLAYVEAGLINTTGTANDSSGSVSAASIAGYLVSRYAGTPTSTVTNGNTQTKTYACGSGNISESVTDNSGNGFSAVGAGDFSVLTLIIVYTVPLMPMVVLLCIKCYRHARCQ